MDKVKLLAQLPWRARARAYAVGGWRWLPDDAAFMAGVAMGAWMFFMPTWSIWSMQSSGVGWLGSLMARSTAFLIALSAGVVAWPLSKKRDLASINGWRARMGSHSKMARMMGPMAGYGTVMLWAMWPGKDVFFTVKQCVGLGFEGVALGTAICWAWSRWADSRDGALRMSSIQAGVEEGGEGWWRSALAAWAEEAIPSVEAWAAVERQVLGKNGEPQAAAQPRKPKRL